MNQIHLPDDIIYSIFTFISPEFLKSHLLVSSQFYKIITERLEWKFDFSGNLFRDENKFIRCDDRGGAYALMGYRMNEWLICKNVKMLNLSFNCLDYCHFEILTSRLQSLRHLCLNYVVLDLNNLNCLLSNEKLTLTFESLELKDCCLTDDMIELLTSCKSLKNLTKLDVRSNGITTKSLKNIFCHSTFDNLRDLSVSVKEDSNVTEISPNITLCKLERLLFEDTNYIWIEPYCHACAENNTITSLSIIHCSLKPNDIVPLLNKFSNLKHLNLSKNYLSQQIICLKDCLTLNNLEELDLESNFIRDEVFQLIIDKFQNLKRLSLLGSNWFSLNTCSKAIKTSKENGTEFQISYSPNDFDELFELEQIQNYCPIYSVSFVQTFSNNFFRTTNKLIISVTENEHDAGRIFENIATSDKLQNLEEIEVQTSYVTLEMVSHLFKYGSLKKLITLKMFNASSLNGFPSISNSIILRNLIHLSLYEGNIGNEGLYNICINCCNLRILELENNSISIGGVKFLATSKNMSKLAFLNLGNGNSSETQNFENNIDDDCIQLLCSSSYLNNLVSLHCCATIVSSVSAQYIVSKSGLPNLSILILHKNKICDRGAEIFSGNVESLRHYNIFDVSENEMTEYGVNLMDNISKLKNRAEYLYWRK